MKKLIQALLLLGSAQAMAATFAVNDARDLKLAAGAPACSCVVFIGAATCTLRAAVQAANACAGADTINMDGSLRITFALSGMLENAAAKGDLDVLGNLVIYGNGAQVDAAGLDRLFDVRSPTTSFAVYNLLLASGSAGSEGGGGVRVATAANVLLRGVTLRQNKGTGGGGVWQSGGTLRLVNSLAEANEDTAASGGGGVQLTGGALILRDSSVVGNSTLGSGGGVYLAAAVTTATVERAYFENNTAEQFGGGISSESYGVLTDVDSSYVFNSSVYGGGALFMRHTDLHIDGSWIAANAGGTGGGVYLVETDADFTDVVFEDNSAQYGGGLKLHNSGAPNVDITSSTFRNNTATSWGGAIDNDDTMDIESSTFEDNTAGSGGAIHNYGWLQIEASTFTGNRATSGDGGAMASQISDFIIRRSRFEDNEATGYGGALSMQNGQVLESLFADNTASRGGGISVIRNTTWAFIENSTLSGNTAGRGGAMYADCEDGVELRNVTMTTNSATLYAGGIYATGPSTAIVGPARLWNTLIAGNTAPSSPDCDGDLISEGHNLLGVTTGCSMPAASGDQLGVASPLIGVRTTIGTTQVHPLRPGSPAIDAGDAATCSAIDQTGYARPYGATCDIGAFEQR